MGSAVLLVVPLLLLAVLVAAATRARPSPHDVAWLAGGSLVPADEETVVRRYLARHRTHRLVGGLLGVALAVVVGIRWYGTVRVGVGDLSPLADVLFLGVAGVVVGALVAESFRLPRVRGPVSASLAPREPLPGAPHVRVARGVATGAVAVTVLALALGSTGPVVACVLGVAVVGLAELTRARVVGRRRPVLTPRAERLDARLRAFAAGSVAHLELSTAVLTLTWVVSTAITADAAWWGPVQVVAVLAGLVVSVVQLLAARPRPPRGWEPGWAPA